MLRVTLDIFSGLPNPSWTLTDEQESELTDRLLAEPSLVSPVFSGASVLGYRGFIVEKLKEDSGKREKQLPSHFRVSSADASAGLWLLHTSEQMDTQVTDFLRDMAAGAIKSHKLKTDTAALGSPAPEGWGMSCASNYLASDTDFSFWNDTTYHISNNNCYNFAAAYRSNTFAQPGRYSGHLFAPPPTCNSVSAGCYSDGWHDSCQSANNLSIALVIAYDYSDFHFYRFCANGHWCHKPGATAATNRDNNGNLITNPETCARGIYTIFCGYYYANNNLMFVS